MSDPVWSDVDAFFEGQLLSNDDVLDAILIANRKAGLPEIDVSPLQGKFLNLIARMSHASRILEIGTLGGYSTVCLARALPPGGTVVTLEVDPHHAKVARRNFVAAGVADQVELIEGPAADSLAELVNIGVAPFDLVFIDADKPNNPVYLEFEHRLSRPGTVIILDNVVRGGAVADAGSEDPNVIGSRAAIEMLGAGRFEATAIQTVGSKSYDGFAIAIVR